LAPDRGKDLVNRTSSDSIAGIAASAFEAACL
jgi:hypothetical protein